MIHFFPTFSKDAKNSPFAYELLAQGVEHRLFPGEVILRYRSRIWLLLLGWPKVAWFGLTSSFRSLFLSDPYPDTVVVGSHIEALIFGLMRALRGRRKPSIVLLGFILTARKGWVINRLRRAYFGLVFSTVDRVICHSALEAKRYTELFDTLRAKFVYIPFGLHISGRDERTEGDARAPGAHPYILTAGRSGRDYATLFDAVEPLPVDLHVVCDSESALAGLRIPANVTILRDCYDDAYVNELRNALFVAIPLGVNDISAGQMVLVQAMAFAKPTIVTCTATIEEYVTDGQESLLVGQGDVAGMRAATSRLLTDAALSAHLARGANAAFEGKFCMRAYVNNIVANI